VEIIDRRFYEEHQGKQNREDLKYFFDEKLEGGQVLFTTFHQSYSYEDFVEGITVESKNNNLIYDVKPGVFRQLCDEARKVPDEPFVLIIDEINRGNISKIFGELITLIEESKRAGAEEVISVKLPYSKEPFSVPNNLYIIGTMNTADRSLAVIDTALRRRFDFVEMMPDLQVLEEVGSKQTDDGIDLVRLLKKINQRIEVIYDREHTIGHSFFIDVKNLNGLQEVFKNKILPLLEEYFYDDWEKIRLVLADKNNNFYQEIRGDGDLFLGMDNDYEGQKKYKRKIDVANKAAFIQIYTDAVE